MTRSLSLGASLRGAIAFIPTALVQAPGALILFALVLALPVYGPKLGLGAWTRPLAVGLALVVGTMTAGALYRLGVSGGAKPARALGLGPLGLQFGAAELRLLAAAVLVGLFLGVVLAAEALVLAFAAHVLEVSVSAQEWLSAPEGWRAMALLGLGLLALWGFVQLAVRLSLYKAATVARRRIVSVSALGLSENNFWRLLCGLVVILLPSIALAVWRVRGCDAGVWRGAVPAVVIAFVQAPLAVGFLSEAYRRLEYWREHPGEG